MEPISDEALAHMEAWIAQGVPFHVSAARTAALIARLRAAEAKALPDGQVRYRDRVYELAYVSSRAEAPSTAALYRLIPLPATPEEDDDGE